MNPSLSTKEKIIKARIQLLIKYPFFGYLAMGLEIQEKNDLEFPTMATDGVHLFYDKNYVDGMDPEELKAVVAHEVMHCALGHLWRIGNRDRLKWNYATDFATNLLLEENGFKLPAHRLLDEAFKEMSSEQIYKLLPDTKKIKGQLIDSHGAWPSEGKVRLDDSKPPEDPLGKKWQDRMVQAANAAKSRGELPGSLGKLIDDLLEPRLDWKTLLRDMIMETAINDFRFSPSAKKYAWQGIYLPSVHGEALNIAIGIDTSGSVSKEEFQRFLAEIRGITEQFSNFTINLYFCDAAIHDHILITANDPWPKSFYKYDGGTNFIPVFEEIDRKELSISVLVFLTDGEGLFPTAPPEYPVIWILNKEHEVPWGIRIVMKES